MAYPTSMPAGEEPGNDTIQESARVIDNLYLAACSRARQEARDLRLGKIQVARTPSECLADWREHFLEEGRDPVEVERIVGGAIIEAANAKVLDRGQGIGLDF